MKTTEARFKHCCGHRFSSLSLIRDPSKIIQIFCKGKKYYTVQHPNFQSSGLSVKLYTFSITSPINGGGIASIYPGWNKATRRPVAIKALKRSSKDALRKMRQEGEILKKFRRACLQYPVKIITQFPGMLILELLKGKDIGEIMLDHPCGLPIQICFQIFLEMCRAVEEIHAMGIIHCDLNLKQFMLTVRGLRLLDFNMSIYEAPQGWYEEDYLVAPEYKGRVFGHPYYIAPEQAIYGNKPEYRSDLFSLGIIFYEMLTGRLPYWARDVLDHMHAHCNQSPIVLGSIIGLNNAQALELQRIIFIALSRYPWERQKNVKEFRCQLENFFTQIGFSIQPITLQDYENFKKQHS